jgi:hypothetical protein
VCSLACLPQHCPQRTPSKRPATLLVAPKRISCASPLPSLLHHHNETGPISHHSDGSRYRAPGQCPNRTSVPPLKRPYCGDL